MADRRRSRSTENGNGGSDSDEVSSTDSVEFGHNMYREWGDDKDGEDVEAEEAEVGFMPYQFEPVADIETQCSGPRKTNMATTMSR